MNAANSEIGRSKSPRGPILRINKSIRAAGSSIINTINDAQSQRHSGRAIRMMLQMQMKR